LWLAASVELPRETIANMKPREQGCSVGLARMHQGTTIALQDWLGVHRLVVAARGREFSTRKVHKRLHTLSTRLNLQVGLNGKAPGAGILQSL
jgi:hypothetical protein